MGILNKIKSINKYYSQAKKLTNGLGVVKYIYLTYHNKYFKSWVFNVHINISQIGNKKVIVRSSTVDVETLQSTFIHKYHLPPFSLPREPIIIDLGCNVGYTLAHYNHLFTGSKLIGVEMDSDNYNLAKLNAKCIILNKAISVKNEIVYYDKRKHEDAYSIRKTESNLESNSFVSVDSITLQHLFDKYLQDSENVDFLKMDIEGEELSIFRDNMRWLNRVEALNIEVHADEPELFNILELLKNHGFKAWKDKNHFSSIMAIRNDINQV